MGLEFDQKSMLQLIIFGGLGVESQGGGLQWGVFPMKINILTFTGRVVWYMYMSKEDVLSWVFVSTQLVSLQLVAFLS